MAAKLLKYGLGVLVPESPKDLDWSRLVQAKPAYVEVPARARGAVLEIPAVRGVAGAVYARVGEGAEATLIERGREEARDLRVEIELAEGARVRYLAAAGQAPERVVRVARLAARAEIEWILGVWGSPFHRALTETRLEGEGAAVRARQLVVGHGASLADVRHEARHLAPRTRSDLHVRAALGGESRAVLRGLVRVERDAPGCAGRQREETLLLSDAADVTAIPDLEILNDRVECGHAATAGRLDGEKLFYLMSRGLERASAERALVEGFAAPFVAEFGDPALETAAFAALEESLKRDA